MRVLSFAAVVPAIFTVLLALARSIGQPSSALKPKIFVLGLSKTGTTSIGDALGMLGYRRLGWRPIRSRHMVHTWMHGDHSSLIGLTEYYDAFEDLPWPFLYREMAQRFPDAKFILSLRKDEQTWLRSMRVHFRRGTWRPHKYLYGAEEVEGNEQIILRTYRNHSASVRSYFQGQPHRLLEVNIDDDMSWSLLCQVALCGPDGTVLGVDFPRSNTAASWNDTPRWLKALQWFEGRIITRVEEQASFYYYERAWPMLQWALSVCWQIFATFEKAVIELYYRLGCGERDRIRFG